MFVNDLPTHMSFNQFDSYEQEIWIEDIEGDTFTLTNEVLNLDNSPVTPSSFFSVTQTSDKHKWLLSFLPDSFTQIATTPASVKSYKLKLSVNDNKSDFDPNTYTITAAINNENHAPTLKSDTELVLDGWIIG